MRLTGLIFLILAVAPVCGVQAQLAQEDESRIYAQRKQVNQFFRRFNGEEDEKGERYYPRDLLYRSPKLRCKYPGIIFDASNTGISNDLKVEFAKDVLDKEEPVILDFHGGNWFSEVHTTF